MNSFSKSSLLAVGRCARLGPYRTVTARRRSRVSAPDELPAGRSNPSVRNLNQRATARPPLHVVQRGISAGVAADAITKALEEMHHPPTRFTDPSYAEIDLRRLAQEFDSWLAGKEKPAKKPSRDKYAYSLESLVRSIEASGDPVELAYLHHFTVTRWMAEQRARNMSEEGIASRLASVKVFSRAFVFVHLELSVNDLLIKVHRFTPPEQPIAVLSEQEIDQILDSFDLLTFEGVRDRAMTAMLFGTGVRRGELHRMTMSDYDAIVAGFMVHGKNGEDRPVRMRERCFKMFKAYMKMRPGAASQDVWLQRDGSPLSNWGIESIFRRVKARCGVTRFHPHLARHTFGTHTLGNSRDRQLVQDMMGHRTATMTARYTRQVRKIDAAAQMTVHAPV